MKDAAAPGESGKTNQSDSANVSDEKSATGKESAASTASPSGSKPCPPPKKVVRNGGSIEPVVELTGGTADQKAYQQSSTAELAAATQENLNKLSGRQLDSSQQDMVSQIQQFLDQSKAALAKGDSERGRNLALKARLLSEELVKP